jgi:hypothetical protein
MRDVIRPAFALVLLLGVAPASAADLGPLEPVADLHRAVHESLGLPEPMIVRLLEAGTPEEHLPVIGHLSHVLGQPAEAIADLHRRHVSFLDIATRFGRGPEIFYVPMEADPGPPYGKAWGYYKKTPRARWNTIRLSDVEVVDLVNLKLCTDHYGVTPDRVVKLRRQGKSFDAIHLDLAQATGKHGKGPKGDRGRGAGGHGRHGGQGGHGDKNKDDKDKDRG